MIPIIPLNRFGFEKSLVAQRCQAVRLPTRNWNSRARVIAALRQVGSRTKPNGLSLVDWTTSPKCTMMMGFSLSCHAPSVEALISASVHDSQCAQANVSERFFELLGVFASHGDDADVLASVLEFANEVLGQLDDSCHSAARGS